MNTNEKIHQAFNNSQTVEVENIYTPNKMTTIEFTHTPIVTKSKATIELENVEKIYLGKGNECRCGCSGEYTHLKSRGKDITGEPEKIKRMLKRFLKNSETREVVSIENDIFEVNVSRKGDTDRVMTIYLKQK